jgi:beta-lactamase class A
MMINLSDNTATNILIDEVGMDSGIGTTSMGSSYKLQHRMLKSTAQAKNLKTSGTCRSRNYHGQDRAMRAAGVESGMRSNT